MCHFIVQHMGLRPGDLVLDYGCAKGFVCRALRLLGINAYGCDISEYAISHCDPAVREYLCLMSNPNDPSPFVKSYDAIISKDTLEHLDVESLDIFLKRSRKAKRALHVIPLGNEDGKYVVPEYEQDATHILRKPEWWWVDRFEFHGWKMKTFAFNLAGIKDNWTSRYPRGNGFFLLE